MLNKDLFIKQYSNETNKSEDEIKLLTKNRNFREGYISELKKTNTFAFCGSLMYRELFKRNAIFEFIYQFDSGEIRLLYYKL